ncbi:MAG: hypothetical protein BM556_12965 [Bacteriovorax sp. MedPE-SWde]|nr:MAG: hypothetical protein BM556_12965 [Bacteriovorax sp. MedPE-SWde]
MKLIASMILIAASVSTFAFGKTKVVTSYSTIAMGPGVLTYNQLCLNANDQLETISPKEICVKYKTVRRGGDRERVCVAKEARIFTKDVEYKKNVCVRTRRSGRDRDNKCVKWELQTAFHNTYYYKSEVEYKWQGNRRDGDYRRGRTLSKVRIEVPSCK